MHLCDWFNVNSVNFVSGHSDQVYEKVGILEIYVKFLKKPVKEFLSQASCLYVCKKFLRKTKNFKRNFI